MIFTLKRHLLIADTVSVALIAIGLAAIFLAFRDADHLLIVHFVAGRGIDFFGTRADVFAIALAGAGLALMNVALAHALAPRLRIAGFLFAYGNALFSLLLFLWMMGIVAVN